MLYKQRAFKRMVELQCEQRESAFHPPSPALEVGGHCRDPPRDSRLDTVGA